MPDEQQASAAQAPAAAETEAAQPPHKRAWQWWLKQDQLTKSKVSFFAAGLCCGFFFVILVVHLATSTTSARTPREVIIPFTDGRPDDLMALNYLAHRSDVLVPFVVVSGASVGTPSAVHRNVRGFYGMINSAPTSPRVPDVFVGAMFSSSDRTSHNCTFRRAVDPADTRRVDSAFGASSSLRRFTTRSATALFTDARAASSSSQSTSRRVTAVPRYFLPHAREYLRSAADKSVVLLALGPLTDIADLLDDQSGVLRQRIKRIIVSGGAVQSHGDLGAYFATNERAETNFFLDPAAAHRVLARQAGDPQVTVVPIDAAASLPLTQNWARLTTERAGNPVDSFVGKVLRGFYASVRPQSLFDEVGVPRDLVAAMLGSSPRMRGASQAFVGSVGVALHPETLRTAGVVGAAVNSSSQPVSVVSAVADASAFWGEYFAMVAAPWPS